jgi:hypothetical protein
MNECSWFSVEERDLVASNATGGLFKVTLKGWVSEHPGGDYSRRRPRHGGETSIAYFLCSKSRPAVIWESDMAGWEVGYLAPGSPLGPAGVEEAATVEYFVVCHGVDPEGDFAAVGRHFGYPVEDNRPAGRHLSQPEEILSEP